MRIAVYPLIGLSHAVKDSNFLYWASRIREAPEHYYYLIVPERGFQEVCSVMSKQKNVSVIAEQRAGLSMSVGMFEAECTIGAEINRLFNQKTGQYPIDVFLTSKLSGAFAIRCALRDERRRSGQIPIIVYEPGLMQSTERCDKALANMQGIYKAFGCAVSSVVFLTEVEKACGLKLCYNPIYHIALFPA